MKKLILIPILFTFLSYSSTAQAETKLSFARARAAIERFEHSELQGEGSLHILRCRRQHQYIMCEVALTAVMVEAEIEKENGEISTEPGPMQTIILMDIAHLSGKKVVVKPD